MAKISEEAVDNLRKFMNRGYDYAGTQEIVDDLICEVLKEIGTEYPYRDEVSLFDGDDHFSDIGEFADLFWDKAIECILNVIATEE